VIAGQFDQSIFVWCRTWLASPLLVSSVAGVASGWCRLGPGPRTSRARGDRRVPQRL